MPALDQCHEQVVRALEKDGWEVAKKPYVLPAGNRKLLIDIFAQRIRGTERQPIIIVEAKCFGDERTELSELYSAIGQYIVYRDVLRQRKIVDTLYLAVPTYAYQGIFQN